MTAPAAPALAKAKLYPLTTVDNGNAKKLPTVTFNEKDAIVVQFNPTSLKIQYTNESTGGETTKAQARQSPVQGHSTLSFDLEFDTAEGDKSGQPLDVRTLTSKVLAFARPPAKPADPPPRVRFAWGAIIFNGIVNSITEDIDYFDADGHALRAKLSLSIKEQNLKFEANASGPPAKSAKAASKPGEPARAGGPGSQPSKDPTRTESAQAGESVQQVLSRLNALPEQWRSAMTGLDSPLDLAAGTPIQLGAAASAAAGAEVSAAFGAAASITAGAAVSGGVRCVGGSLRGFRPVGIGRGRRGRGCGRIRGSSGWPCHRSRPILHSGWASGVWRVGCCRRRPSLAHLRPVGPAAGARGGRHRRRRTGRRVGFVVRAGGPR